MKWYHLTLITVSLLYFPNAIAQELNDAVTQNFYAGYEVMYSDSDSANLHFDKAVQLSLEDEDLETALQVLEYSLLSNGYFYNLNAYRKNLITTDSIINRLPESIPSGTYQNSLNLNTGNYYYKLKEYERSKAYFIKLISEFDSSARENLTSDQQETYLSAITFLASIYKNTGKFELAEVNYKKANSFIEALYPPVEAENQLANINRLRSQLYSDQGNVKQANALLYKLLPQYEDKPGDNPGIKNTIINTYHQIAQNLLVQDSVAKAIQLLNKGAQLLSKNDPFYKNQQLLYGDIYTKKKDYPAALDHYKSALFDYQIFRNHQPHQDVADVYYRIAKMFLIKEDFPKAMKHLDSAFQNTSPTHFANTSEALPKSDQVFSKRQLLELYKLRIRVLLAMHKDTQKLIYLDHAVSLVPAVLDLFDLLKKEFESKLDKRFVIDAAQPLLGDLMQVLYLAYEHNPQTKYLNLALQVSETGKDVFLQEAIRSAQATEFLNISEEILLEESTYKSRIAHLEKQLFTANALYEQRQLQNLLSQAKDNYYGFLEELKNTHAAYYNLKFKPVRVSMDEVQTALSSSQSLITYTRAAGALYILVFTEKKSDFFKIPFSKEDQQDIRKFYEQISSLNISNSAENFKPLSENLYQKLLAPIIPEAEEEIIIIPDGILHYLPFDVLMRDGRYLLYDKAISYADAVSSWISLNEIKRESTISLAAFAPAFFGEPAPNRIKFGRLLHNGQEVESISPYFTTKVFKDASGSLSNFLAASQNHDLLHLATHASANDEFPDYSYLAFSESKDSVNILYVKDLYNTPIPAQLVTLSACQTGIGKLQNGEGMVSLSKGFQYAGALSIVNSLWKINDKSTVTLMDRFYKELSDGKSKAKALQQAKIAYLQSTDDDLLKHPYYWAAFSVSGNSKAVVTSISWIWYLVGGFVALGLIALVVKMRTNRSA
ncbi:MAG: CHAT domain-containing protein [Leeuwenhoekiella sp.]